MMNKNSVWCTLSSTPLILINTTFLASGALRKGWSDLAAEHISYNRTHNILMHSKLVLGSIREKLLSII